AGWLAFVAGLVAAPLVALAVMGRLPVQTIEAGPATLVFAGLLVGFGTGWGNCCTSGHRVFGPARVSVRAPGATLNLLAPGLCDRICRAALELDDDRNPIAVRSWSRLRRWSASVRHVESGKGSQLPRSRRHRVRELGPELGLCDRGSGCGDVCRLPACSEAVA